MHMRLVGTRLALVATMVVSLVACQTMGTHPITDAHTLYQRGDYAGARDAFRRAMDRAGPSDSLYRAAQRGLDAMFGFDLFGQAERTSARRC